jgi:ketosteroid isomerase-like protein
MPPSLFAKESAMATNQEIAQQIYAAFGRGDVPGIMEFIAEDMQHFGVISASLDAPWHLQIKKKADVPKFFQALAEECTFTHFEPHDFAAAGDHVYCSIKWEATFKRTGRKSGQIVLHHFTFKNGRVVSWRSSEDTALTRDTLR